MCASRWLVRAGLMKFRTNCCKHLTRVRYFVQQQKTRTGNDRSSSRPREQSRCDKPAVNVSIPLQGRLYCYHKKKKEMNKIGGREHEKMENCFFFRLHFEDFDFFWLFGVRRGEDERLRERRDRLGESLRDLDLENWKFSLAIVKSKSRTISKREIPREKKERC